jgi:hypothetical protein
MKNNYCLVILLWPFLKQSVQLIINIIVEMLIKDFEIIRANDLDYLNFINVDHELVVNFYYTLSIIIY